MPSSDPFAGIRLSEQTSQARLDQRLFVAEQPIATAPPTVSSAAPPAKAPPKPAAPQDAPQGRSVKKVTAPAQRFDLKEPPLYKASFLFTQAELEALEDLKLELGRRYDTKVTKNSLVRCALHFLLEDHEANAERGYVSRKVRKP